MKPPFGYYGSKVTIATQIAAMLPPHGHYVEPFAGALAVLLAKPPARMETVNDLDGDLMTFWEMLRDRPADLARACALTPHSRAGYAAAYEDAGDGRLEQARRTWVKLTQGRAGTLLKTGWRYRANPDGGAPASVPAYLKAYAERMPQAAERLQNVTLECRPALEVIAAYGRHPGVLIFADPPYPGSVRNGSARYQHEMAGDGDHCALLEALLSCRAAVVLSGYASPLYDEALAGWHRAEIAARTGNGRDRARTEVLWSSRPFGRGSLFDAAAVPEVAS